MKYQKQMFGKDKKFIINLCSAEFFQRMVKVNTLYRV